ncbi:hypothetical protein DIPPA_16012 [Diplonema papillatum]|nr:hypothetical protein DIPPA_21249 [Diplonema papillatum]KAJ9464376.1 hypothetical protein DIPPA_16012 [Diplonema papillatum]
MKKMNYKQVRARESLYGHGPGLFKDKTFSVSKGDLHFDLRTKAEKNLCWNVNSKVWELKQEAFHDSVIDDEHASMRSPRQQELEANVRRDSEARTKAFLFGDRKDKAHFEDLRPSVSRTLAEVVERSLPLGSPPIRVGSAEEKRGARGVCTRDDISAALVECGHEVPLSCYYLQHRFGEGSAAAGSAQAASHNQDQAGPQGMEKTSEAHPAEVHSPGTTGGDSYRHNEGQTAPQSTGKTSEAEVQASGTTTEGGSHLRSEDQGASQSAGKTKQPHAGVVSADLVQGYGGAIVTLRCESVEASVSAFFLSLAKKISKTAAALPLTSADPLSDLLTAQCHDSEVFVEDLLVEASGYLQEVVSIAEVALVPWPENALLGWHVNNPRNVHTGQGSVVTVVLVMFPEVELAYLEPEWRDRLQDTIPHVLAQHYTFEPLWFGVGGRSLKQHLLASLPPHERLRFPDGMPSIFDWLSDICQRHRTLISRFGVISAGLGLPVVKKWVSFSVEDNRYYNFSLAFDPQPRPELLARGDYSKHSVEDRIAVNHAEEELWYNEPGEKSFDTLAREQEAGVHDPVDESDDELMNAAED